jgi:hypothetical protein
MSDPYLSDEQWANVKREPLPPHLQDYEIKVQAYAEAITDAVRIGVGHAITLVEDYANETPLARPYCDDITAMLRRTAASITTPGIKP